MIAKVEYQGDLRTAMLHLQSNSKVITDAPVDNHGKGEAFSPTDLVATALASCMMTIMGIKADDMGVDITGTSATVKKHMSVTPRRISEIEIEIFFAISFNNGFDKRTCKLLEASALTCPVAQSLHPDTKQTIRFIYPE